MATVSSQPVEIYAAQDPTTSWTFGSAIDLADHVFAEVVVTATATSPTSYQFKWQESDDGVTWVDVPIVEAVAGLGTARTLIIDLLDDDGTVLSPAGTGSLAMRFERIGKRYVRPAVKRTGGAATDRLAMTATRAMV